jgi:hypothetical protein
MSNKFIKTAKKTPPLNQQVLCRSLSADKKTYIYELGEIIETKLGIIWLDDAWGEMGVIPEEWSLLPQPEGA